MKLFTKIFIILLFSTFFAYAQQIGVGKINGIWMAGDFHQHTYYTDGSHTLDEVIENGFKYGLDFQANSEHGGSRYRDGYNHFWDDPTYYPINPIKGDVKINNNGHQEMWRWQSLSEYVYPHIQSLRNNYQDKLILTGVEWNVPAHEHCNIMIQDLNNFPYVAVFEYYFDASDIDTSEPFIGDFLPEKMLTNSHEKAVEAAKWLQEYFAGYSWMIPTHPERRNVWHVEDFRDLNNAAPDVAFGFDGMPGHQKETERGSFGVESVGGGTYGGAGYFIAKVGGLWDALLGEGRHWWNFVNSDFHNTENDFWPGEYAKTYVYVRDLNGNGEFEINEIVNALRSGNSFAVHGDLINALEFTVKNESDSATMGDDFRVNKNSDIEITVAYKSPANNNNGDKPVVHHIDLIAGEVTGKIQPNSPDYTKDTNETTRVIKRFNSSDFSRTNDGWNRVTFNIRIDKNTYFRLRGTNLAPNTPFETDQDGNPLVDSLQESLDGASEAWADLWFYSNPIFVYVN